MKRKAKPKLKQFPRPVGTAPADTSQWSEQSQRSYSCYPGQTYTDIDYVCLKCQAPARFTAEDQKHTYEVQKAYISQRRLLCEACHVQANRIAVEIAACEEKWAQAKDVLRADAAFLALWLRLLQERESYGRGRANIAAKAMLKKLLDEIAAE